MAKLNYLTTIAIDTDRSVIHFYSMTGNDRSTIVHQVKSYRGAHFDVEFFETFKLAVKEYAMETPSESIRKVTVVLPDSAVLLDAIKVPTMKGSIQTKKALNVTLGNLYKNFADLRTLSYVADQNKQYSTFVVTAVKKHIISSIYAVCAENKLYVDTLTFASCSTISGALSLHSKIKNDSYLFLDVKEHSSKFIFVVGGKTVGSYPLPFGLDLLNSEKVIQEDMLFNHSYAELFVINARERAKSKKLTMMGLDAEEAESVFDVDEDDEDFEIDETPTEVVELQPQGKVYTRKTPRKLPKFMQREIPETKEDVQNENFRTFIKWALSLIKDNDKLVALGEPSCVLVNVPKDLEFLIDKANEDVEENGIRFARLLTDEENAEITLNLELFGGLFTKTVNQNGKL